MKRYEPLGSKMARAAKSRRKARAAAKAIGAKTQTKPKPTAAQLLYPKLSNNATTKTKQGTGRRSYAKGRLEVDGGGNAGR